MNNNGSNVGSKVLLVIVAVLNAARNSFSFFLLLIVCMGYGVVKPTLGKTMIYVRWLAVAHFVFGIVYAIASLYIAPDAAGKSLFRPPRTPPAAHIRQAPSFSSSSSPCLPP